MGFRFEYSVTLPSGFVIGNAAGTAKTLEQVADLARSGLDEILVGTITVPPRPGNSGDVFFSCEENGAYYNALGLPNPGLSYYALHLKQMADTVHAAGKSFAVSILGLVPGDAEILARLCMENGVDTVEYDASCPNLRKHGELVKPLAHGLRELEETILLLAALKRKLKSSAALRLKLPYFRDREAAGKLALLIGYLTHRERIALTSCNSLPSAGLFHNGKDVLSYTDPEDPEKLLHEGGLSGEPLRMYSLDQNRIMRHALPYHQLYGAGGISRGRHILEYARAGVTGVQIGGALYASDDPCRKVNEILEDLAALAE